MDRLFSNEKGKAVKTYTGMNGRVGTGALAILLMSLAGSGTVLAEEDLKADALSAAWPGMQEGARVVDWEGNVLQEGSNGFTCMPTPPVLSGTAPMCLDELWMEWAQAWQNKEPFTAESIGVAYMLSGDEGASNVDPYAEGPTDDNEWVKEGPHLMLIAPAELLENFPTDPHSGGPYVMWKGTDYQHLMIPVAARE